MIKKIIYILVFYLFAFGFSFTHLEVTTAGGKKVIFSPEDAWKSVQVESLNEVYLGSIPHLEIPKSSSNSQIITHTGYTLSYNPTYHIADWVAYELTDEETVPSVKRNNHFIPDPLLTSCSISNEDYKGTGYDKGHLAASADMCYSYQTMVESFYLSNMAPQSPSFNRGIWKRLEEQVRQWAIDYKAVYVVTGTVLTKGLPSIGFNKITVPARFYKVILDYTEPDIKGIGFIIPNQGSQEPLQNYAVTIDSIEKLTGTDFFYQLPDNQEWIIESTIDLNKWSWTATKTYRKNDGNNHIGQAGGVQQRNNQIQNTNTRRSVSVRCSANTKKGTQCSRMTVSPNGKCWQHGGN